MLTAFGFIIDAIVKAFGGGAGGTGGGFNTEQRRCSAMDKRQTQSVGETAVGKLAGKAAAALPGIIGSIISAVLNF